MTLFDDLGLDAEWRTRARCLGADTDAFFVDVGQPIEAALRLCDACEVRSECLAEALTFEAASDFGVWGGTTPKGRRRLREARQRLSRKVAA